MKTKILILFLFSISFNTLADETARQYLISNLEFWYIPDPNFPVKVNLDNKKIASGTITDIFAGNANMSKFDKLIKDLLRPANQGGNNYLQIITYKICKLSQKPIVYFFADDKTINLTTAATFWSFCFTNNKIWPCAWNEQQHSSKKGLVVFGSFHVDQMTQDQFTGTFLHESTHTRDFTDARIERYSVGGVQYRYSSDNAHYIVEAIPNFRSAYKEGIAYVMTLMYDQGFSSQYYSWYNKNDLILVDTQQPVTTPNQNPGASRFVWLYDSIKAVTGNPGIVLTNPPYRAELAANYRGYNIRSLPPQFILHDEIITALIIDSYNFLLGYNVFLNGLNNNNKVIGPDGNIGDLFNFMCKVGLPPGKTFKTLNQDDGVYLFLMPLAYADFFTNYASTSAAKFNSLFENKLDPDLLSSYWDHRFLFQVDIPATGNIDSQKKLFEIATKAGLNRCTDLWVETGGK